MRQCTVFCAFRQFVVCGNAEPGPCPELHVFGTHVLNWNSFRCGSEAILEIPRSIRFLQDFEGFRTCVVLTPCTKIFFLGGIGFPLMIVRTPQASLVGE